MAGVVYALEYKYEFVDGSPVLHYRYEGGVVIGYAQPKIVIDPVLLPEWHAGLDTYIAAIEFADAPELVDPIVLDLNESNGTVRLGLSIGQDPGRLDADWTFKKSAVKVEIKSQREFGISWHSFLYFVKVQKVFYSILQGKYTEPW